MEWQITRKNTEQFATAKCTTSDDTFETLADRLNLDFNDYKKWANTNDETPKCDVEYKIPNTIYMDYGKNWPPSGLFYQDQNNMSKYVILARMAGFKVVNTHNVNSQTIRNHLRTNGIYMYFYNGHGSLTWLYPQRHQGGVRAARYTPYKIMHMALLACESATKNSFNDFLVDPSKSIWNLNISSKGTFAGYVRKVNSASSNSYTSIPGTAEFTDEYADTSLIWIEPQPWEK